VFYELVCSGIKYFSYCSQVFVVFYLYKLLLLALCMLGTMWFDEAAEYSVCYLASPKGTGDAELLFLDEDWLVSLRSFFIIWIFCSFCFNSSIWATISLSSWVWPDYISKVGSLGIGWSYISMSLKRVFSIWGETTFLVDSGVLKSLFRWVLEL